jgi:hypothetical protein
MTSAMPFLKYMWAVVKFQFALFGDVLVSIPVNIVVFIRNILPGRWSYKCFSCRYLKAAARWLWMGESTVLVLFFRPLTIGLLHWHFRSRLSGLRHQIVLETGFSEDETRAAFAKIDRATDVWQQRTTLRSVVLTWCLPLIGPFTQFGQFFVPAGLMPSPVWARYAAILSVSYSLAILGSAFLVKRGLMLGATGHDAYYPGFVPGPGAYEQERKILNTLGLELREFPLDIAVLLGSFLLTLLTYRSQLEFLGKVTPNYHTPGTHFLRVQIAIMVVITLTLTVVSSIRRKKLGRA